MDELKRATMKCGPQFGTDKEERILVDTDKFTVEKNGDYRIISVKDGDAILVHRDDIADLSQLLTQVA